MHAKRNKIILFVFLGVMVGLTGLLTLVIVPGWTFIGSTRDLYKCEQVVDGDTLTVQLRSGLDPNPNPLFAVHLAGIDAPPLREVDDPELKDWAARHNLEPALVQRIAKSSYNAMRVFVKKQNVILRQVDGQEVSGTPEGEITAHVLLTGTDAAYKQLLNGMAVLVSDTPQHFPERYAEAEAEARKHKRGLWQ